MDSVQRKSIDSLLTMNKSYCIIVLDLRLGRGPSHWLGSHRAFPMIERFLLMKWNFLKSLLFLNPKLPSETLLLEFPKCGISREGICDCSRRRCKKKNTHAIGGNSSEMFGGIQANSSIFQRCTRNVSIKGGNKGHLSLLKQVVTLCNVSHSQTHLIGYPVIHDKKKNILLSTSIWLVEFHCHHVPMTTNGCKIHDDRSISVCKV